MRLIPALAFTLALMAGAAIPATADDPSRVIGGGDAPPMPTVTRLISDKGLCTSTLIAPKFVLSAAHCVVGTTTSFRIHSDNDALEGGELVKAVKSTKAPNADLAIFELEKEVAGPYSKLATEAPPTGSAVEIYGWGQISNNGPQARKLKVGKVKFTGWAKDHRGGLALNLIKVDGIASRGDSGGPAMVGDVQVGVASTSDLFTNTQYTSVAYYLKWIKEVAGLS